MKKKLLAIVLAAALLGGIAGYAVSQPETPTVVFDASKNEFIIKGIEITKNEETGVQNAYPDLFPNLKDMMPGDSVEQEIKVQVINANGKNVKLFLRADGFSMGEGEQAAYYGQPLVNEEKPVDTNLTNEEAANATDPGYEELFGTGLASLTVSYPGKDAEGKDTTLTSDDGVFTATNGVVELGTFSNDQEKTITVNFALSPELGNTFQNHVAKLGWVFTAQVTSSGGGGGGLIVPDVPPALNKVDHFAYIVGYPDGNVKPQGNITRAEVATIFFRMLTDESRSDIWSQNSGYSDVVPGKWFNNAVSTLANGGILTGYEDGTFKPNANITRAEFATMAVRFFSSSYEGEDLFPDIDQHWAKDYINTAANEGIINGYEDGTFRPSQPITRAEAMAIVNRVLERHPDKDHLLADMIQWPDNMDTGKWYYADVQEATNSHDYDMEGTEAEPYEVWTKLLPVRDWVALEQEWSDSNSSENPGDVVK